MRFKHLLLLVGLTLTVIHGRPSAAAMPQIDPSTSLHSSQFASNNFSGDVRQSAFCPLGYDSGFWRTEYAALPAEQNQNAADNPITVSTETRFATPQTQTAEHGADKASDALIDSDSLAVIPIEIAVVIGPSEIQAAGKLDELPATTQSDWEYAAANAGGIATAESTKSGPSVTSAIVGFVGIVIVIGAYASSGARNQ